MRVTVKDIHSASNLNNYAAYGDLFSVRYLIRPLSFHIAALFATLSISANGATWISLICGLTGAVLLAFGGTYAIGGAILLLLWNLLDHVDGNLARYYQTPSKYGDYLDTLACYLVLAFFPLGAGIGAWREMGGSAEIASLLIFLGGIGAVGGILPRLFYQKLCSYGVEKSSYQNDMQDTGGHNFRDSKHQ